MNWKVCCICKEPPESISCECLDGESWLGWVKVNPTSGSGDTDVTISTSPAKCPSDLTTAFVVISADTDDFQVIPVTRCKAECTCDKLKITGTTTLDFNKQTGIVICSYEYRDGCTECLSMVSVRTDGDVLLNPRISGNMVLVDVQENTECSRRNGWFEVYMGDELCGVRHQVSQGVNPCANDDNPNANILFGGDITTVPSTGKTYSVSVSCDSCWYLSSSGSNNSWINLNGNTLSVSSYDGEGNRSGSIYFNFEKKMRCGTFTYKETRTISQFATLYKWIGDGYICDGGAKYKKEKEQRSDDGGSTWTDTGNTRKGSLIEECSADCGCPTECTIVGDDEIDSCSGGTKQYTIQKT